MHSVGNGPYLSGSSYDKKKSPYEKEKKKHHENRGRRERIFRASQSDLPRRTRSSSVSSLWEPMASQSPQFHHHKEEEEGRGG